MKRKAIILVAVFTTLFAIELSACGDSLYRVGKGVSYRVYTAPLPGSVLVYGQTEGAQQLAEELARSGHGVRLVSSDADLQLELRSGNYDVVIAAYSDHAAIESSSAGMDVSQATYIPVAQSEEEEALAKQSYNRVMMAQDDEIKHYLKAIHKTLKQRT